MKIDSQDETFANLSLERGYSFGGPLDQIIPRDLLDLKIAPQPHSDKIESDRYWMLQALRESLSGVGITSPNPAVGCVIVDEKGCELARGATQAFRGLHAEAVAFQNLKNLESLEGATAYVTLEPCSHHGNQPPCVDLLVNSTIRRVVVSRGDPDPRVNGKGIARLKEAGKEVEVGLLANETTAWNFGFFVQRILNRPMITLKWAQTLDGQLADDAGTSKWISGPASRAYTHWLRQHSDAILVGAGTLLKDHPRLNVRNCSPPRQMEPLPIIFDPKGHCLRADAETIAQLARSSFTSGRSWVLVTSEVSLKEKRQNGLEKIPEIKILTLPVAGKKNKIIAELIALLQGPEVTALLGHPMQTLFVEGGPQVLSLFLREKCADLLQVFISPKLTAGQQNRISLTLSLREAQKYELLSQFRLGQDTVLEMISAETRSQIF